MSKFFKYLAYGVGVLVLLFVAAAVIFAITFDPNDYKNQVTKAVQKETGRELILEGDLSLSFFPWLGFETGAATFANAEGFGDKPFAVFDSAAAKVKLIPLLSRRVEIGEITLAGLDLNLIKNADGSTNWDDLAESADADESADEQEGKEGGLDAVRIGALRITDASIVYDDRQAKSKYIVDDFNLITGAVEPGKPFDLDSSFMLTYGEPATVANIVASGRAASDIDKGEVALSNANIKLDASGAAITGEKLIASLASPRIAMINQNVTIDDFALDAVFKKALPSGKDFDAKLRTQKLTANLENETADFGNLLINALGLDLDTQTTASDIFDDVAFKGSLKTNEFFSPRDALTLISGKPLETADSGAMGSGKITADYVLKSNALALTNMTLLIDESTITGKLAINDIERNVGTFALNINQLNADRYLPPGSDETPGDAESALDGTEIPTDSLTDLNWSGSVEIGALIFAGIVSKNAAADFSARRGKIRLHPARADLYGGKYSGDIRLDVTGPAPSLSMNETVTDIQIQPLFKDVLGEERLSGITSTTLTLTGVGNNIGQMRRNLNGNVSFGVRQGAIEGVNLWYELRKARALFKREPAPEPPEENRTLITQLNGTGVVTNGVMRTNDLAARLPYLEMDVKGDIDLAEATINWDLDVTVLEVPEFDREDRELMGGRIPVKISGPLTNFKVRPDMGRFAKQKVEEKVKEKATELLGKIFGRDKDEEPLDGSDAPPADGETPAEGETQPLEETEETKDAAEQLEDELKKKLKDIFGGD